MCQWTWLAAHFGFALCVVAGAAGSAMCVCATWSGTSVTSQCVFFVVSCPVITSFVVGREVAEVLVSTTNIAVQLLTFGLTRTAHAKEQPHSQMLE